MCIHMYLHMYIRMYDPMYIRIYIHTYNDNYIHMPIHRYIQVNIYICLQTCVQPNVPLYGAYLCPATCALICTLANTIMCTFMCTIACTFMCPIYLYTRTAFVPSESTRRREPLPESNPQVCPPMDATTKGERPTTDFSLGAGSAPNPRTPARTVVGAVQVSPKFVISCPGHGSRGYDMGTVVVPHPRRD